MLTRMIMCAYVGMQQRFEPVNPNRFVRMLAVWMRRCLHVETQLVPTDGRLYLRVLGPTGVPVPVYRRPVVPAAAAGVTAADQPVVEAAARLTPLVDRGREAYFRAARQILAEQGSDGVTVGALCDRLGVTKGSFQYHFGTMPGFVEAMTEHWEKAFSDLLDTYDLVSDPLHRLERMFQATFALQLPTEAAWRAWGWTNPVVGAALHRMENKLERQLSDVLGAILGDPGQGALLGEFSVGVAIGLGAGNPPLSPEEHGLAALEWARYCVGLDAQLVMVDGVPRVDVSAP